MKLAFDVSVFSSRQLAVCVWMISGAACFLGWPFDAASIRLTVGLTGLILGAFLTIKRFWLVNHPASRVLLQIQDTLQATCVAHQVLDNSVHVMSTGTKVNVRAVGPITLVEFRIVDPHCNKERFLLEVLTKYLRFIGKEDADG